MMCFHRFKYGQGYPSAGLFFRWFQKQIILYRKWRFSVHKKGVMEWKTATYCVRKSCLFGYHLFKKFFSGILEICHRLPFAV